MERLEHEHEMQRMEWDHERERMERDFDRERREWDMENLQWDMRRKQMEMQMRWTQAWWHASPWCTSSAWYEASHPPRFWTTKPDMRRGGPPKGIFPPMGNRPGMHFGKKPGRPDFQKSPLITREDPVI